jgi:8-oxo-dGTP pyrophosphatase MutT (NUDIX family)
MAATFSPIMQAAAIPVRSGRVCLVKSHRGNWVVPKGRIEPGQTAAETALQEAWEEAGLVGTLRRERVGNYSYQKSGRVYHVTVFLLEVTALTDYWPERKRRPRRWVRPGRADQQVKNPELRKLLCKALSPKKVKLSA